ncbi:hypothetical protein NCAS_0B05160 [Naumovozyma castellii]|uniref:Uncharacterized protein n=1 Tax=Naumovozyma castellii TaxID=27288 RepID=G0V9I4_NAUCA|nr:hypothetical protein NCAS_0B05160 [Naumovozyma castellii CBS 4309]CCC68600.1 hypothetical protein NCAS_0B05160 [Naumovozyma castellii CBS 4309]
MNGGEAFELDADTLLSRQQDVIREMWNAENDIVNDISNITEMNFFGNEEDEHNEQEEEEEEEFEDFEEYEDDLDYNSALIEAQQQWDESLEQLNKVLNWILLPMIGKIAGRRVAGVIWRRVMNYIWKS